VADQADVLEYVERMGEIRRLAAQVVGDVVEFGFLREEVPGLAEQRAARVEDGTHHPVVEVLGAGGHVALGELPTVGRGAPDDGVREGGGARVRDVPELCREPVAGTPVPTPPRGTCASYTRSG
jgi:hypothetical protein